MCSPFPIQSVIKLLLDCKHKNNYSGEKMIYCIYIFFISHSIYPSFYACQTAILNKWVSACKQITLDCIECRELQKVPIYPQLLNVSQWWYLKDDYWGQCFLFFVVFLQTICNQQHICHTSVFVNPTCHSRWPTTQSLESSWGCGFPKGRFFLYPLCQQVCANMWMIVSLSINIAKLTLKNISKPFSLC